MPVDSELARRLLLEVFRWIPCGVGVLDAHGGLVLSNNVLESWLSPAMGGRAEGLFEDPEVLRRLLTRAQRAGSAREAETMAVDAQGRRFSASVIVSSMNLPGDHAVRFLLILEDISDKKLSSQELLRTEKLASLGTMAGGVAHDFNNILMTILGNTQLLHKELSEADSHVRRRLKNIEQAVLDGAHVVRRLQVFTGKDRGVSKGEDRTVIHEAVHDVLELTRPRWKNVMEKRGTRVEIVKDLTPNLCAAINAADFREC
ncbi:MAG: hypothetical protein ACUVSA_10950 [Desulfosoma sp.]|uniref:hypothetical protein n=1 Tax=Desulfosoma sp. TaxID=2603217 RepID=UPI004049AD15